MTGNPHLKHRLVERLRSAAVPCRADNLQDMAASWKKPGRARRVRIDVEDGGTLQYCRSEDDDGTVLWREESPARASGKPSGDAMTSAELLKAIEASLQERRRAGRGLKFRL
jgi:hypothetical protein